MKKHGQTICLCMIVKNEAHVIRRCLDSLSGFIDTWAIVDTGSSDGTQDIIREHLAGLPGELIERPWVNFAHNRTEALRHARGRSDYIFVIDADEVLVFDEGIELPRLDRHAYHFVMESGGVTYFKTQLVDGALDWCFKNVLHEYIYSPEARTEAVLPGVRTVRFPDGARARDPLTYRRDALMIEQALLDEPDNTRYVFYLAQSYRDAGELDLAIRHYRRRAEMGGWVEEVWYSLYQVAEILERKGEPWPQVMEAYLQAFQAKPDRAGPLFRIGLHYQEQRQFDLAHLFFRRAMRIPYPANDRLFIEKDVYRTLLPLEYAVSCYFAGDDVESVETNNRLLMDRELPPEILDRVEKNRRFSLDRMHPRLPEPTRHTWRVVVLSRFRDPGPWLDDCVESLLEQDHRDFLAIFIDDGSRRDYSPKMPDDLRFVLLREGDRPGLAWQAASGRVRPDDLVLPLDARDWLADPGSLGHINAFMNERACSAVYGQHRFSTGHAGVALPIARPGWFGRSQLRAACARPVAFRGDLLPQAAKGLGPDPDWADALGLAALEAAGFDRSHFNERPIVVVNIEAREAASARGPASPARGLAVASGVEILA